MLITNLPQHFLPFKLSSSLSIIFLYFFYTFLLLVTNPNNHLVKAHIFIYAGCSQDKYQPNSPFASNLNSLLSSIVSSSSQVLYNSYALGNDSSAPQEGSIYGLYQCRGDLQLKDCATCVASAVSQINLVCSYTFGASLQLDGCYLRYENTDFLGKPDTSLRYNKCSKNQLGAGDGDFLRRRDDVLTDLEGATGFKVSSSGSIEGFAQCVGDLSVEDCNSCVSDAVMKLKTMCGSAAAADVFLGQCYARYWASGYYHSSDSSNDDDVGKTVAIIVGVLAGVAVFIVLLSFCRKAVG
ncbi:PREDICTED: cysteine-rich repeat secretory protein 15 [Nicotiana attenuata]|uniref:Cysteine-rich repeat secretory protein 15 n=1 Tax=Nicotiana attenuata TaxID=49451 RepID=A0A1J6KH32_NICAT|nr:PREDICTED: cysteine-rich repeat secretory protein 15 [Nicotiana attenuata]OIT22099.1 cysteine-rich repeat secretory protein 15 [Nicotiana attenuata]